MAKTYKIFSKSKLQEIPKTIIADHREKNSLVISELLKLKFKIQFKQLEIGDYQIKDTIVERKSLQDFKSSILNKRIFSQLNEIKKFPSYLLILEGLESTDPYNSSTGIHENAFRGLLLSILLRYQIPIIITLNEKDTAKYLYVLTNKTQNKTISTLRIKRTSLTTGKQLQFILEGFPGVGPQTSRKLLQEFKSLKNIINAPQTKLENCIGTKAKMMFELIDEEYKSLKR